MSDTFEFDYECDIKNSPTIKKLEAKDAQLQMQVNNLNDTINKRTETWGVEQKWIKQRLDDVEAGLEDKQDQIDQTNTVISEIGDNIALLKWMSTRQDEKIAALQKNVILDETYFNFEDWVENVYLTQWGALVNKFTEWDLYINANQDVAATNATYVCVRPAWSTAPLSADDWQVLYYSAPADMMTILWIDPVKVTHPYKHEWVISIDPNRLSDMLAQVKSLDLSKVDVTLWEVYFEPIFKENATIQENLTVWNTTTTKDLEADTAYIKKACIKEFTCDPDFKNVEPEFWEATFNNITTKTETVNQLNVNEIKTDVHFTWVPTFEWEVVFTDPIEAPNADISQKLTVNHIEVHNDTHLNWSVNINWYLNYTDPGDPEAPSICVDNALKNLFRPSYWLFTITWSWQAPYDSPNNLVFWLWSDAIALFNNAQWADAVQLVPLGPNNRTNLVWDEKHTTPWVQKRALWQWRCIQINGNNWQDSWLYKIDFNMTIEFDDDPEMNIWSHRAWVVVYEEWNLDNAFIIDDKTTAWHDKFKFTYEHSHWYYDCNDWDYSSGSRNRTTNPVKIEFTDWDRCNPSWVWSDVVERVWNHYTYTKSLVLPVTTMVIVAPFFKPSAWCNNKTLKLWFKIPEWKWNTWSTAQVFVHKISSLYEENWWVPYEYNC